METAVRIRSIKISKKEMHQMRITVPSDWMKDHGLVVGDTVDLLKDTASRLILVPGKRRKGA